MPKKRLTEEGVTKLKPPAREQVDYFDAGMPGLVLRVNYGGAKVWRALYYLKKVDKDGKRITMPTTQQARPLSHIKLKEAREKARQFLADPRRRWRRPTTAASGRWPRTSSSATSNTRSCVPSPRSSASSRSTLSTLGSSPVP